MLNFKEVIKYGGEMKKILIFLLLSVSLFAFRIENIEYNKSINSGYREYKVYNDGLKKIRYKVELLPFGEEDITDCLKVYPRILTIEPQSYKILKIFGESERELEKKEYPFYLSFKQMIIPTLAKDDGKTISGIGTLGLAPKIEMKGYGGIIDFSKELDFINMKFSKDENGELQVNGDIVNNSYATVEIGLNFHNLKKTAGNSKGIGKIEPESRKNVTISLPSFGNESEIATVTFYNDVFEELKVIELKKDTN